MRQPFISIFRSRDGVILLHVGGDDITLDVIRMIILYVPAVHPYCTEYLQCTEGWSSLEPSCVNHYLDVSEKKSQYELRTEEGVKALLKSYPCL